MKKIEVEIRPHKLELVRDALAERGIRGMTVQEVRGLGSHEKLVEHHQGKDYLVELLPKIKLEMVVAEKSLDDAIKAILQTAKTGDAGDGNIFVSTVEEVIRVRTEESGESVLS